MIIIYSFNKKGFEAEYWGREISGSSSERHKFIPFNHDNYLDPSLYLRAQFLDNIYFNKHAGLLRMYGDLQNLIQSEKADALIVDNCFPYHPEFLRKLKVYKVLRTSDGPLTAYDRDFAYLHAYDHVLYHTTAYSSELGMAEKLQYCGAKRTDFWPLGSFNALCDPIKTEADILSGKRDIDIIFIGALHPNKMPLLATVKKALGRGFKLYGLAGLKKNVYFNLKYGFPGWIKPVDFRQYVPLYQRSKIGINVHNRGDYTVGSYRLFDLPANGVMQISDGGSCLSEFFSVGEEVVSYRYADDLIAKIEYYLDHEDERKEIALKGYKRVIKDHRIRKRMHQAGELISRGMDQKAKKESGGKS